MLRELFCKGNVWKIQGGSEGGKGKVPSLSGISRLDPESTGDELFLSFYPSQALTSMATDKSLGGSYSYISLFRTPVLRKISLCSGVVW